MTEGNKERSKIVVLTRIGLLSRDHFSIDIVHYKDHLLEGLH